MPINISLTAFAPQAPPWNLAQLDGNFTAIAAALANPLSGITTGSDVGAANVMTVNPTPAWTSYVNGSVITVVVNNNNTGATTLNVSGLGATSVRNPDGTTLIANQLLGSSIYLFIYQSGLFILVGGTALINPQSIINALFPNPATDLENILINGDMRVSQVNGGTASSVSNGSNYAIDQWATSCSLGAGTGTLHYQRVNTGSNGGGQYSLSFSVTTAKAVLSASDSSVLSQPVEGLNGIQKLAWGTANARSVTLQFRFITNIANAVLPISIYSAAANRSYTTSITTGAASTWATYSVTIPGDTSGVYNADNTQGFGVAFDWAAGSSQQAATPNVWQSGVALGLSTGTNFMSSLSNTWSITDVDLKAGVLVLPITRRSYEAELLLCQRYLPVFNSSSTTSIIGSGFAQSATTMLGLVQFPVPTRVVTTGITSTAGSTFTQVSGSASAVCSAIAYNGLTSTTMGLLVLTSTGMTIGAGGGFYFNSASGQLVFTGAQM